MIWVQTESDERISILEKLKRMMIATNNLAIGLQENGGGKKGRFEGPCRSLSTNVNILQDCL